mgnify:CR=1 FL=1
MAFSPNFPPVVNDFFVVSVSVSSPTSAAAAGVGSFRGLYFRTSSSVSIVGLSGNSIDIDNFAKNSILWIQGAYVSVIATATNVYGVI